MPSIISFHGKTAAGNLRDFSFAAKPNPTEHPSSEMNKTDSVEEEAEINWNAVLRYSIYIVEGSTLSISNLLIVAAVLKYRALRNLKEFLIIAGLALVDSMSGIAAVTAGPYRIYLIFTYQTTQKVSRAYCFWTIHNVLWAFAFPLQGIMLLIVSCDRLLAVSVPLKHLKWGRRYGWMLIGGAYGLGLIQQVIAIWLVSAYDQPEVSPICLTGWGMDPDNYQFIYSEQLLGTMLSILVYVLVFIVYKTRLSKMPAANDRAIEAKLKKQRKLTVSLGVSCVCTFLFFGIPNGVIWVSYKLNYKFDIIVTWAYIINNINPILNTVIYLKIKEMRIGMKALLSGKHMPVDVSQWNTAFPSEAASRSAIMPSGVSKKSRNAWPAEGEA